jgi:mono/diheme cytochrome c family protein
MKRDLRVVALVAALGLGGCDFYYDRIPSPDDALKLIPWFDHMITSPAVHPYEAATLPRNTPRGSVPVDRIEADWQASWDSANYAVGNVVRNPVPEPARTLAKGDTLYQVFCAVCHGSRAAGDGPVGRRVGAPSLLTEKARALSDGHLYSLIRYGRGVMPRYGDKIFLAEDRWAVVNYLRSLQAAAGPAPTPGGND